MRIPRIFTDQNIVVGSCIDLSTVASHHVINVLRMATGKPVILFNGSGGEYTGIIAGTTKKGAAKKKEAAKKIVSIDITDFHDVDRESTLSVELAVCLIKNERMDWLLQKATELGATKISLLISERTNYKIKADRIGRKLQHWDQIVTSACEQSGRTRVPVIDAPLAISAWLKNVVADRRYILHPSDHQYGSRQFDGQNTPSSVALLIGPEGGFADTELTLATSNHFSSLMLGPRILRAETAPLAALAVIQRQFGDWSFSSI